MGTIGSNPSNPLYPVPGSTAAATNPTPAKVEGAAPAEAPAEAPAGGEPAASTSSDVKDTTAPVTTPATPDLKISKEMASALSSTQVQNLIDGILADGTVDKLDDAKLKQLNILLDAAAKKNDGKVDDVESSLLDALDSRGMFGTNREVVKTNLQSLKKHDKEANSLDFSGGIKLSTQDGVSGFFGGKQERALTLIDIPEVTAPTDTSAAPVNNTVAQSPAAAEAQPSVTQPSVTQPSVTQPSTPAPVPESQELSENTITRDARSAYAEPTVTENNANEARLKEDLQSLKTAFHKVPDEVIAQDITALVEHSDTEGSDLTYIKKQLENWNIQLPTGINAESPQDIKQFLETYKPTADNISAYRSSIDQVIDRALQESPLTGSALSDARNYLYDKNYIFENKEGVSDADYQKYSQFKTNLLNYQDSESKARSISRNDKVTTSNIEVDNKLLEKYNGKAVTEIQQAASELNKFLKQVEPSSNGKNTFGVSNTDIASLRNQLGAIVEIDAQGQMVMDASGQPKVKQPVTQEHLQTLNKVWASVEAIGIAAKLDQEPGEITEKFFDDLRQKTQDGSQSGVNQWNAIQQSPAGEILTLKPELAQYADLLKQIEANPKLKEALFSSENPEDEVNRLLAEHNTAVFNDSFGSLGSLWDVGPNSFLTSWGCRVPGVQNLSMCSVTPSKTSLLDSTLPLTLPQTSLSVSPLLSKPVSNPAAPAQLDLGQYTTQDVRNLLDLLKNPPKIEGQSDEAAAVALAQQKQLRAQLSQHSGELSSFISDTPELAGLRQQLDAKEAFDNAFWGGNSELEQARQSIKTLTEKQDRVGADLAVAEAQIKAVMADLPEGDTRTGLNQKLLAVQQAQAELKNTGQILPSGDTQTTPEANTTQTLQSVMNSLTGKGIVSDGKESQGMAQNLVADTQAEQMQLTIDKTLKTLASINSDPVQKQQVLEKFPEAQREQISHLLSNHQLLEDIRKQIAADPAALDPSTLQAFAFAGYMTDLAQNGTPEQIKTALEGQLPGSSLKVSDAINHMDRLLTHVDSIGIDDPQLKATYVQGLSTYFNEVFKDGQSVEQAWKTLENEDALKNVQQGIIRNVYQDSGMSDTDIDALFSGGSVASEASQGAYANTLTAKNTVIDDFLRTQQNTLQGIVARGNRPQGTYESLLFDYTGLEKQRDTQQSGATASYDENSYKALETRLEDREKVLAQRERSGSNFSVTDQEELQNIRGLLAATRASMDTEDIKAFQVKDAMGVSQANGLFAVLNRTKAGIQATASDSEELVDDQSNQRLFNQFVPEVKGPNGDVLTGANGQAMTGQEFVSRMLGAEGATSANIEIFELNFGALQDTQEGELLYQKTLTQARSNEYAQLSYTLANSDSDDPNNANIFAFGESLRVGNTEVNKLISGPQGTQALEAWNSIIQKHGERLKSGQGFNPEEYARDLDTFGQRFGITNEAFLGYASGNSFKADAQELTTAQQERRSQPPAVLEALQAATEKANTDVANMLAAVSSSQVSVEMTLAPSFSADAHPGFSELVASAQTNMERAPEERLDGLLAVENLLNRDTARIVENAHKSGDFSLLNQVQQMQATALQGDLERSDNMRQALSEITGTPFVPHSDRYRAASGLSSGAAEASQQASQLVNEANQLASRLSLTAEGGDSDELLSNLVGDFLNIIRDQDYKTRQLVMAQLANQMMTDSITNFYKDKTDKNNKYHQDALERMSASFSQNIQRSIQDSLVSSAEGSDTQSVAAVSGQVGAASTAEAMGVAQLRASADELLSQAQQMEPPLLSDLQKERILDSLFDRNPDNDALGIMALAGLQSFN